MGIYDAVLDIPGVGHKRLGDCTSSDLQALADQCLTDPDGARANGESIDRARADEPSR